jgi:hypothetical protein
MQLAVKLPRNESYLPVELNGMGKEMSIAGKGHSEILDIVNPVELARTASETVDGHVPENGGTCTREIAFTLLL